MANLVVTIDKNELFSTVKSLQKTVFSAWLGLFVLIALIIYVYVIIYVKKIIKNSEKRKEEYKKLAYTDRLTEIYSRMYLEYWLQNVKKKKQEYYLIMIDVDKFKQINDQRGHLVGDQVLKTVAKVLESNIDDGIVVRFGGDEFLIIVEDNVNNNLDNLIERISSELKNTKSQEFVVELSFGISRMNGNTNFIDALKEADKRMYVDKNKEK